MKSASVKKKRMNGVNRKDNDFVCIGSVGKKVKTTKLAAYFSHTARAVRRMKKTRFNLNRNNRNK